METNIRHSLIAKINVKSGLLAISFGLCIAGFYMCFMGLQATGSIDIKSIALEGKITTGSLGLLVIFLAIPWAMAAKNVSLREKHVEISHGDLRVTAANMNEAEWSHIVKCVKEHEEQHSKRQGLASSVVMPSEMIIARDVSVNAHKAEPTTGRNT